MQQSRIDELVQKFLNSEGSFTAAEADELDRLLSGGDPDPSNRTPDAFRERSGSENTDDLFRRTDQNRQTDFDHRTDPGQKMGLIQKEKIEALLALSRKYKDRTGRMDARMHQFLEQTNPMAEPASSRRYRLLPRYIAAASLAGLLGWGIWFGFFSQKQTQPPPSNTVAATPSNDALPASDKAILTLADGSRITLDSTTTASIPDQGNSRLEKLSAGQLAYKLIDEKPTGAEQPGARQSTVTLFNSVTTPRGGQFSLVLPDGTRVWLNNASSLRYPTAFGGGERRVALTGEAYFEVSHQGSTQPFFVDVLPAPGMPAKSTVQVLGTHFDINAYSDEETTKTTLLEGSVKVLAGTNALVIKPGEQARVSSGTSGNNNKINVSHNIDVSKAVAWKDGFFNFDEADIHSIMRQLSRFYDVEVVYQGSISDHHFDGRIQRHLLLSQLLENLETKRIHFKIEEGGRKVVVTP